ncbi:MAG: leukotoxin LktA family filamentous adhesin, partial [Vampirovibrionia bacterium]
MFINAISRSILGNFYRITCGVALAYTLLLTPVYSQQIVIDGYTNTALQTSGDLTKVTTSTTKGNNAFNSFSKFNVDTGKTVNLIFPGETQNLINVIKSEQSTIDGTLNAVKNNHIGGNMFLVNPYGVIVGTDGVINTGSLTIATPPVDTVNAFFPSPEVINDTSVNMLLNGTMPVYKDSVVSVNGKINAITDVHLSANKIVSTGLITTNAVFDEQNIDIGDVVNLNTLEYKDNDISNLVLNNGTISIKSKSAVDIMGSLYAGEDLSVDISSEDSKAYMNFLNTTAKANNITLNAVAGTYENKTLLEGESLNLNAVIRINTSSLTALNDFTLTTTGGNISNINIEPESYFSASVIAASAFTSSKFNVGNNLNISNIGGSISNLNAVNSGNYAISTSAVSQFSSYGTGSYSIVGKTATFENLGGIISATKTMNDNKISEDAYVLVYLPTIKTGENLIVTAKGGQVIGFEPDQKSIANVSSSINIVSVPISANGNISIENIAGVAKYVSQVNADASLSTIETRSGYITSQQKIEILNQVNPGAIIAQSGNTYSNISLNNINISSKKGIDIDAQIINPLINGTIDFSSKIDIINSASITSSDNINLTTPGVITINGTISLDDDSGLSKDLIINEDNTIDPLSTIGALQQNNLFIVEDTSLINSIDYNKLINLNGEIKGTGKIITKAGPLSINIVNNSDSDIVINNLKAVVDSYENIFNNGKAIDITSVSQIIQHNYSSPDVNITSKEGTSIILNGNIESIADLGQNLFLTINADNSIDTNNAIKTQIDNNIITVSDINLTGLSSYISISGDLQGVGNIKSVAFIPEVSIINNSQNDLNIKGVKISDLKEPHIILNNEELNYNAGNITITKDYSGGNGNIVINNTTNSDILISDNIYNPFYDVYLTNKYGNILLYEAPYIIAAKNIYLTATEGSIGIPDAYVNIDENDIYGSITANAGGNICLREISGDMRVANITSQNADIYLSVRDGGVISASTSNIDNISGRNLYIGNPKNYYFLDLYGTLYRPKDFLGFLFDTLQT